jgi:phage terminase large subunit-like protein
VKLTARQQLAQEILSGDATHLMLEGGSRSGKTFLLVRNVVARALKAPGSRHAILRFRFNAVMQSIVMDTFPKVMEVAFPGVSHDMNKSLWYAQYPNGSQVWFGGLDDKERTEKVLGQEHATIYLNEASQISWEARNTAVTRLAQKVDQVIDGVKRPLKPRMYYDCNPPSKAHWAHRLFVEKVDPETRIALPRPEDYVRFRINPQDNVENISEGYLDTLKGLSARLQRRFLYGEWSDSNPNALFHETDIDKWRVLDGEMPEMVRIVVGVDPSGSDDEDNAANDEIGVVVGGLGTDGRAYLLEDCTLKAGPATWAKTAVSAFDRHKADCVVGEENFGGAMVKHTIQTARPHTPYKKVTASRGKHVRAEPFSALYEQGKVRHAGQFVKLEDELCAFSTHGYTGQGSPNRADAWIWVLTELFPGLTRPEREPEYKINDGASSRHWMAA